MDFVLWLVFGLIYIVALVVLGSATWSKGHLILFFVGFFMPLLWIVGALLPPTNAAETASARARLR